MKNKFLLALILVIGSLFALCACGEKEKIPAKWTAEVDGADFVIEFAEGQDIKVLQLTDLQRYDWQKARSSGMRRNYREERILKGLPDDQELTIWRFVDEAVANSDPDLIVLTGDNISGATDDNGEDWLYLINRMDSYGIPWLCLFGNHDNESGKGVTWQVEQLMNSEYCIFAEGEVTGNSNYNVLIKQGDEYKYLFYLLDTHGEEIGLHSMEEDNIDADKAFPMGLYDDQIEWLKTSASDIYSQINAELPVLIFQHIQPIEYVYARQTQYPDTYLDNPFYATREGDLGFSTGGIGGFDTQGKYWAAAKEIGCVGMFMGHDHSTGVSIVYDGIRITFGMKSSLEAGIDPDLVGSTLITINEKDNSFNVEYHHTDIEFEYNEPIY